MSPNKTCFSPARPVNHCNPMKTVIRVLLRTYSRYGVVSGSWLDNQGSPSRRILLAAVMFYHKPGSDDTVYHLETHYAHVQRVLTQHESKGNNPVVRVVRPRYLIHQTWCRAPRWRAGHVKGGGPRSLRNASRRASRSLEPQHTVENRQCGDTYASQLGDDGSARRLGSTLPRKPLRCMLGYMYGSSAPICMCMAMRSGVTAETGYLKIKKLLLIWKRTHSLLGFLGMAAVSTPKSR
ncbi:hypothetical protein BC834DRAFT_239243 [Gloeopeniophorella convolvens]|nr:hypothetical protein BC834DRAFT_239243 [Gloeopeniophorella convolvens]